MYQIRCPLREAGTVGKNQVGLICPEGRLTFYEYDQAVSATAQALKAAGVAAGDRLTVAIPRGWQQPVLFFAALRAGAIVCPVENGRSEADLARDMETIASSHLVMEDAPQTATGAFGRMRAADIVKLALPITESGLEFTFEGDRPAVIVFSGKADARRAILHSYSSMYYGALATNVTMDLRTHDRWLIRDAFHEMETMGAIFRCAVSGATLVMADERQPFFENVLDGSITHAFFHPQDLERLLGSGRLDKCRLKMALVAEPLPSVLLQEAHRAGVRVHTCYMIPEVASQVAAVTRLTPISKWQTAGTVMRYGDLRIAEDGRIQVRGRALFDGYVHGKQVLPATDESGWFTTGDHGLLDGEGYLTVMPRL